MEDAKNKETGRITLPWLGFWWWYYVQGSRTFYAQHSVTTCAFTGQYFLNNFSAVCFNWLKGSENRFAYPARRLSLAYIEEAVIAGCNFISFDAVSHLPISVIQTSSIITAVELTMLRPYWAAILPVGFLIGRALAGKVSLNLRVRFCTLARSTPDWPIRK